MTGHKVSVETVAPGDYKARGQGLTIDYGLHETRFGTCLLAITARGITYLSFAVDGDVEALVRDVARRWPRATLQIDQAGTRKPLHKIFSNHGHQPLASTNLFLRGTNFQLKVWEALLRIPFGDTATYLQIANAIGHPKAVRAVGNAVGANPVSFLIPCHRVIQSTGAIGNYRWGSNRKKAMLAWESDLKSPTFLLHGQCTVRTTYANRPRM